jgi:hypothetical protein
MALSDQTLYCRDCNQEFIFTVGEQEFYASHNLMNAPTRCPSCRAARKNQSSGGYGGGRHVEQLRLTNATFAQHLDSLERINPKSWNNLDLHKELSKALSVVDDARAEYTKSLTKINAKSDSEVISPSAPRIEDAYELPRDDESFVVWLKRGFAFTLPLLIFALCVLVAFYFMR